MSKSGSIQPQIAYEALRADLLACRLLPGARVRINKAADDLGVNPGAVREALSRLAAEGLVIATQQRGFRAAPVSVQDLTDLTPVRIEIEINCLRRSLRSGDIAWEARLKDAYGALASTPMFEEGATNRSSDDFIKAHDEFHQALVAACDNRWLLRIRDSLYMQWERYRRLAVQSESTMRNLQDEHEALFRATIRRNEALATSLIADHFRTTTEILLSASDVLTLE